MRRNRWVVILCSLILMLPLPGASQEPKKLTYEELLAKARNADPDLDFTALRMAYAASEAYAPYGADRAPFDEALAKEDFAEAIRRGEQRLAENFLDVWAHWAVWQGANELSDQKRMDLHAYMLRGILGSIRASGDGKTHATAFHVVSTDETYFLLTVLGLRFKTQSLQHKEGHSYDAMTVADDETGEEITLYFNVDLQMGHMNRLLNPPKPAEKKKP